MLETVSKFCGILTVRTHSAYAAFSLNIPAVMIYFGSRGWAGKSSEFMSMVGCPENAICCDGLAPETLVERFDMTIKKGWNQEIRLMRKKECLDNFLSILKLIGIKREP